MTAAFDARYVITPAPALMPPIDVVLMIDAAAVLGHVPGRALAADHHAEEVDRHHPLEVGEVVVEEAARTSPPIPALLHITWSPPKRSTAKSTTRLDLVGVGDVGRAGTRPRRRARAASASPPLGVDVGDDDLRALVHEPLDDRRGPMPLGAAGDDRDLARELGR